MFKTTESIAKIFDQVEEMDQGLEKQNQIKIEVERLSVANNGVNMKSDQEDMYYADITEDEINEEHIHVYFPEHRYYL